MTIKTEKGEKGRSELKDLDIHEVSIVGKTANGKKFLTIKSMDDSYTIITALQKSNDGDKEAFNYFLKSFVEKATKEQMAELGFEKSETSTEDKTEKKEKTEKEDKTEKTENSTEDKENFKIDSIVKGIGELTEMVQDLSTRIQDTEETIGKMRNTTKSTGEGEPMKKQPKDIKKSEYTSDEITMGK